MVPLVDMTPYNLVMTSDMGDLDSLDEAATDQR
jgi:hypothetical protein